MLFYYAVYTNYYDNFIPTRVKHFYVIVVRLFLYFFHVYFTFFLHLHFKKCSCSTNSMYVLGLQLKRKIVTYNLHNHELITIK